MTNDLPHRLRLHCTGRGAKYTRSFPPESVASLWSCDTARDAARLEYAIKTRLTPAQKRALVAAPATLPAVFPDLPAVYVPQPLPTLETPPPL